MPITLNEVEARVLGCLVEKSLTTPELYPLTLNSIVSACNQKTSRDPVMNLDDKAVGQGLFTLMDKGLAERCHEPGDRVPKFRHHVEVLLGGQDPKEIGAICVLLLRGPQTPGEIKTRGERLCRFESTAEVESVLQTLSARDGGPFVARMERLPGQKEARYRHLFAGAEAPATAPRDCAPQPAPADDRVARLEKRVEALETRIKALEEVASRSASA